MKSDINEIIELSDDDSNNNSLKCQNKINDNSIKEQNKIENSSLCKTTDVLFNSILSKKNKKVHSYNKNILKDNTIKTMNNDINFIEFKKDLSFLMNNYDIITIIDYIINNNIGNVHINYDEIKNFKKKYPIKEFIKYISFIAINSLNNTKRTNAIRKYISLKEKNIDNNKNNKNNINDNSIDLNEEAYN